MNIFIIRRKGILDTSILVKNDITAQAVFNNISEELLGEDIDEIGLHSDSQVEELNYLICYKEVEVFWFEDVSMNTYINK